MRSFKTQLQEFKQDSIKRIHENDQLGKFSEIDLDFKACLKLESEFKGKIVYPWDADYNQDRKEFNDLFEEYPKLIAYPISYQDVSSMLNFARTQQEWLVLRSGGHSLADFSNCSGVLMDMSELNNIHVNPAEKTLWVQAGATFEKIVPAVEAYKLHMPSGGCPSVGIAGFMMGGGYSLTSRKYGMNCDTVLAVDVMLADGSVISASKTENQDLFWAIRGGTGGNFGILLSITYQLFDLDIVYGKKLAWSITNNVDQVADVLCLIQETILQKGQMPNLGIETMITSNSKGERTLFVCVMGLFDKASFNKNVQALLDMPGCQTELSITGKYSTVNDQLLEGTPAIPPGIKAFARSLIFEKNPSKQNWIDIINFFLKSPNNYTMIDLEGYGGAINEMAAEENAFIHRNGIFDFYTDAFFDEQTDDREANEKWIEDFYKFLEPMSNGHSYQNYPNRNQSNYAEAFWGNAYSKLQEVKKKYDPGNFFHFMQSIKANN